jgi:integrase
MHALDGAGVQRLLGACGDPDLHALVFVAVTTGLRQGEVLALRWSDVDLADGGLRVVRSLQYLGREGLRFAEPKTARSRRRLALSPDTVSALGEHRRRQLARRLALGPAYEDQDLVFPDPLGRPAPPPRISHRFGALVRRAGVGPLRFHDLRHTHATLLLQAGVHPKVVSERLGNTSVSITLDTYSHVLPGLQEQAVRLLDGILQRPPAGERLANG